MRKYSLAILLCWIGTAAGSDLPDAVLACVKTAGAGYAVGRKVDPPHLRADFDGDGTPDVAVLVTAVSGSRTPQGIAVCLSGTPSAIVLGAGTVFHYMKDLDFTAWHVNVRGAPAARAGVGNRKDAFVLEWESASGLVYWNGRRFVWQQQGD